METEYDDGVTRCEDGKYRWVYEMNLFKNPVVFLMILGIFIATVGILWVFLTLINMGDIGFVDAAVEAGKICLIVLAILGILTITGYILYSTIMGGKYCVLFTMDENGVNHAQYDSQVKKAQLIGEIAILAGLIAGNPTTVGAGLVSATRSELYTKFSKVTRIKEKRRFNTIQIDNNMVFVKAEDYDFILSYIVEHCPNASL